MGWGTNSVVGGQGRLACGAGNMTGPEPLVSIIIPVYNRPVLVREAIGSALESASLIPMEVIVVDDVSTDETWESVCSYGDVRVRALRMDQNGGQSAARNRGLDAALGAYVKYLDSDDLLMAGHLEREVRTIQATASEIVVSGWMAETAGTIREYPAPRFTAVVDDILAGIAVPTSAALYVRRSDWRWDPALRKLDDWDYFVQAGLGVNSIATAEGAAYVMRDPGVPRASGAGMLINAREHHRILHKIEDRLAATGSLTTARRRRLAQYFYKELRVLSLNDLSAFESGVAHVLTLDPDFVPRDEERQWWMRVAARLFGTRRTILMHTFVKKTVKRLQRVQ